MARNFQNVFLIFPLCIAVIFISGIFLPRYLSNQYFQLSKELNSQTGNSKYSSLENLFYVAAKTQSQNESKNATLSNENIKVIENFQSSNNMTDVLADMKSPAKVQKRSKRRAEPDEDNEIFSWNFKLNVTRHQNFTSQEAAKDASDDSYKNKHLRVALVAEGEGKRRTAFSELQNALRSVETFLMNFFVNRIENVTYQEGVKKNQLVRSDKESLATKPEVEAMKNPDFVKSDSSGNGNKSFSQRGRERKFLFGTFDIFRFGGKSLDRSTSFPEEERTISSTEHEADSDISKSKEELLKSDHSPKSELVTENSLKVLDLHPESLVSQTKSSETDFVEKPSNAMEFNVAEVIEVPLLTNETEEIAKNETSKTIADPTEPLFTDEVLEMFCMSLVNKVEESQQLSDADEENGFDSEQNVQNRLRSSQNTSLLDLLDLFNSLPKKESKPDSDIIEDSFLVSNGESASQSELPKQRQSRFINLGNIFGFGSGRSAIIDQDESNDLTSDELEDLMKLENLPSILDCESYFRKKQSIKMFPKPNLMDMISDPKIELVDFANANISSKLKEHQIQFLTDLFKTNLNNTIETFDKNSEDAVVMEDSGEGSVLLGNESYTTVNMEMAVDKEILIPAESSDFNGNDKLVSTSTNRDVLQTDEMQRDGRFINILGFGSGSNANLGSEERWFIGSFFGSGSRSLETLDSVIESDRNELGSGDSFKDKTASFSDDAQTPDYSEDLSTISPQERRFWELLGFGGSGDGRELTEAQETTEVTHTESENDSNNEITLTIEQSHDCDDYGCNLDNSHDQDGVNEQLVEDHVLKNESDCHEDCYPPVTMDRSKEYDEVIENSITIEQIPADSKNLTENFQKTLENCTCLHKQSDINITFSECDECSFSVMHSPGESYESTDSYSYKVSEDKSLTKSREDYENGSLDEKQKTKLDRNLSFSECDECNFNDVHPPYDSYDSDSHPSKEIAKDKNRTELHEDYETDFTGRNISFSECDDCSFNVIHTPDKNITSSECDDCFDVLHTPDESYEITENFPSEELLPKDTSRTKSYEDYEDDCHDCDYGNDEKQSKEMIPNFGNVNQSYTDTNTIKDMESNSNLATFSASNGIDEGIDNGENLDSFTGTLTAIQNLHNEQTTEMKDGRFMEIVFLTGSGDGSLFGDGGGQINLVEEENTIVSPAPSRRRGRFDDILIDPFEMLGEGNPKELEQKNLTQGTINAIEEEITDVSSDLFTGRRGILNKVVDPCDDCDADFSEMLGESNSKEMQQRHTNKDNLNSSKASNNFGVSFGMDVTTQSKGWKTPFTVGVNETAATVSSDVFPSSILNFSDVSKSHLSPRFCKSASECNVTLNERCVTINSSLVCGCSRAYVRHKETGKCVVKRIVETSMKLPAEEFDQDLKNPSSPRYKQMRKNSNEMMWFLLQHVPELLPIIAEIDVAEFGAGSLIVSWNLVFAVENKSEAELIKDLKNDLQEALKDERLLQQSSLDVSNASLISINDAIDLCKSSELNYCSVNAYCLWNEAVPGRFACVCKEHYQDVSSNPRYVGETCIATCSPDYCGPNGHCEILANDERHCLCSGLYFGRRCDVSGMYVLIIMGVVAFISITILLLVIFRKRCRTRSYGGSRTLPRSQETVTHSHMNGGKVSDTIALEENVGATVSKFVNISTPVQQAPVIRVTRPTINESSISFEYDSTFDTTSSSTHRTEEGTATV